MAHRRTSEWLSLAGDWVLTAVFTVIAFAIVAIGFAWLAIAAAQLAFRTGILALEIAVVTVLMLVTAFSVWLAFTERRLPSAPWAEKVRAHMSTLFGPSFSEQLRVGRGAAAIRTLMVAFFAVASFASLASLLYLEGAIEISKPVSQGDMIIEAAEVFYWHLFDTVPLLDIPQNLEWDVPFEFEDSLGGLLVILFTAIVILPLIRVVRAIWTGHREPYEDALRAALGECLPDWKTTKLHGETGYERAFVEGRARIVVDVMHDVSTEDAALRRLEGVCSKVSTRRKILVDDRHDVSKEELALLLLLEVDPSKVPRIYDAECYLLVVDAVAERARDRIDEAFGKSTVPAELVVWRDYEPGTLLAEAVERLAGRIASARKA